MSSFFIDLTQEDDQSTTANSVVTTDITRNQSTSSNDSNATITNQREFQFNHKYLGLTYPRCNLTKRIIEEYFRNWVWFTQRGKRIEVKRYLIAQESHQPKEGDEFIGTHFHVYLEFNTYFRGRNPRAFDIDDFNGTVYHPHFSKVYGYKNMIKYCTKEDKEPIANFEWNKDHKEKIDWDAIYRNEYNSPQEFLDNFCNMYPSYFTSHYIALKQIAYDKYIPKQKEYVPRYLEFANIPPLCLHWVDNELHGGKERPLALVLVGESRTGKTEWARSLGKHMYMNAGFNLSIWDPDADYIVIDDFDVDPEVPLERAFRNWKQFFGAQREFTLTDKYCRKQKVTWGKPMIFISNNELNCKDSTRDYIRKNSLRVNVYNNFY